MTPHRVFLHCLLLALLWSWLGGAAFAESLPNASLDSLADDAELVLVALPLDAWPSFEKVEYTEGRKLVMRFRVVEVLKGLDLKAGDEVSVRGLDLYWMRSPGDPAAPGATGKVCTVELSEALLFLEPDEQSGEDMIYAPVLSGIRLLTRDEEVLRPTQYINPGPMFFDVRREASWQDLLGWVRDDVARSEQVRALRRIDDSSARNAAICKWVRSHAAELDASPRKYFAEADQPGGYGGAVGAALRWVVESSIPKDAWTAIRLYNRGRTERWFPVETRAPTFCSPEGRRLLVDVALDTERLVVERRLALELLAYGRTLREQSVPAVPELEVASLSQALTRLAEDSSTPETLAEAATTARTAVKEAQGQGLGRHVLDELLTTYRTAPVDESGNVNRNGAAMLLRAQLSEEAWQKLSGNPRGILITFYLFPPDEKGGRMQMGGDRLPIFERPTLTLERLADDGSALETRRMPLPVTNRPPQWSKGWTTWDGGLAATFPTADLAPGRWRATVEGTAGDDRVRWRSEPQGFLWPPRR